MSRVFDQIKQGLEEAIAYTRRAYVTVLSDNSYINGVVVLDASLKAVGSVYPLVCIVTPDVCQENRDVLKALNIRTIDKDIIKPVNHGEAPEEIKSLDVYGWLKALVKFNIYDLTEYDKIIYIDSDVVIKQNIDDLFEKPHMSATIDVQRFRQKEQMDNPTFCSCLLVIKPDHQEFLDILDFFYHFDGQGKCVHDQWVLQEYYKDWINHDECILDMYTCPWTTYFGGGNEDIFYFNQSKIKALHIIDRKPWNVNKQYFIDLMYNAAVTYPYYGRLNLEYIDLLNYVITKLKMRGITSSYLKIIN